MISVSARIHLSFSWRFPLLDDTVGNALPWRVPQAQILVDSPNQGEHIRGAECLDLRVIEPLYQA